MTNMIRRWQDRRRIRALRRAWEIFRATLEPILATVAEEVASEPGAEAEARFLALKEQTAKRLPVLGTVVGRRALEQEALAALRDMTELMNRTTTLATARRLSAAQREDLLREWHVLYIFLAKLEGAMTGSAMDGAALAGPGVWAERDSGFGGGERKRSRLAGVVVFALEAAIVIGFVFAAASILGIGRNDLRLGAAGGASVGGAGVAQAPTGETEVTAPAAPTSSAAGRGPQAPAAAATSSRSSFRFRMPRLVQPVIMRYGTAGAFVLLGAFASGLLLVFGVRSR